MMRAFVVLGGLLVLSACGGGGTTGTNYAEAPPVAEIVGTPTPKPSATPVEEASPVPDEAAGEADNAAPAENAAL
jgi:hypothetical protein